MIPEFPHQPPKGYSYEFETFKRHIISIWLRHHATYDYNLGKSVRTIWGFYNSKTKSYHSPVNSATIGSVINLEDTRSYTSMPILLTPLEAAYV